MTLVGAGGAGKTRLALQAAADMLDGSGDGVWLVELAPLAAPGLVASAACGVLGLREESDSSATDRIVEYLRERELLLVLDNCEHVLDACAALADRIVRSCPGVVLLATSRQALGLDGEHAFRVPSLGVPGPGVASLDTIVASDAVQLIRERARQHDHEFELDDSNAVLCGAVCRRLDGMPLALELAAARLRSMSLADVHDRLDQRFRLLTRGSRTAMPRQQTLRATVDWSYELLDPGERQLLRVLSVFAGGFELESAGAVGASVAIDPLDVADLLDALVDKTLVQIDHTGAGVRYRLLETVRQYAAEQLDEDGRDAVRAVRRAHAGHFLELAERLEAHPIGERDLPKLARLEAEHENLRLAFGTLLKDPCDAEPPLRMLGALLWYLDLRGHLVAGGQLAERALAHPAVATAAPVHRVRALLAAAQLAVFRGDSQLSVALLEPAHELALASGDRSRAAAALRWIAFAQRVRGARAEAARALEPALELAIAAGDRHVEAQVLSLNEVDATTPYEERLGALQLAVEIFQGLGDLRWSAVALNNLGNEELAAGDLQAARVHLEESMRQAQALQNESSIAYSGITLVLACIASGDLDAALAHLRELTEHVERLGYGMRPYLLVDYPLIASGRGDVELGATLHGAADTELRRGGSDDFDIAESAVRDIDRERLRGALGAAEFERLYRAGTALDFRRALELADQS